MYGKTENPNNIPGINNLGKYLVMDFETGGTDPKEHSALTLAMGCLHKGKLIDSVDMFIAENKADPINGVQPDMVVTEMALEINKLDAEWIYENGLSPKQAFVQIENFLNKNFRAPSFNNLITIVGHNVKFDLRYLERLLRLARVRSDWYDQRFTKHYIDTLTYVVLLKEALGLDIPSLKLGGCLEHFGIEVEGEAHSALVDVNSTAKLFTSICQKINPTYPEGAA